MNEALRKLEALLSNAAAVPPRFPPNSRYSGLPTLQLTGSDGRVLAYVTRRFIPGPEAFPVAFEHLVVEGDRLDTLAGRYIGDPERWWSIADANPTLQPEELIQTVGRVLVISGPGGGGGGR